MSNACRTTTQGGSSIIIDGSLSGEDIVQAGLLKAYEKLDTCRASNPQELRNWTWAVITNHAFSQMRKFKPSVMPLDKAITYSPTLNPEQHLIQKEREQWICSAMSSLSDKLLYPLLLATNNNYQTIAEKLGITLSTAKVRIHRARKTLRQILSTT